jgi:hypothetical protein
VWRLRPARAKPIALDLKSEAQLVAKQDAEKQYQGQLADFRERVEDERRRIRDVDDRLAATQTNILIAGSVGGILASVTFLKDLAAFPAAGSPLYLRVSWLCLLLSCGLGIGSLASSRRAGRLLRDVLYARVSGTDPAPVEHKGIRWNRMTRSLQWGGYLMLTLGVAFLAWFAHLNLPK